jgi:hypothetical protein
MLSQDLEMLFREFDNRKNAQEEVHLSASTVRLFEFVMRDCIGAAKALEANVVPRPAVMIDLSDPKVRIFPKNKRPVPAPDEGGAA